MKISIITVAYNSAKTIRNTIESVLCQTYNNIEYIIVDGKSSDNTLSIVKEYKEVFGENLIIISQKDDGLYDAMNKGIHAATGEVVGILNSDDFFTSKFSVEKIANEFQSKDVDGIFADVQFVKRENTSCIIRTFCSKHFRKSWLRFGIAPPHPTFYLRKSCYEKYGYYKIHYKISADFDLITRMISKEINVRYLNAVIVTMRDGGISTKNVSARITSLCELKRACKENNIYTNTFLLLFRFAVKIWEFKPWNMLKKGK